MIELKSDIDLLQAIQAGDEIAFQTLYKKYYNYLMVVGLRYLTDTLRVEDVINDIFMKMWNMEREVNVTVGVKQYLRGAVVNTCLSVLRKDNRMDYIDQHDQTVRDDSHSADKLMDAAKIRELVDKTVANLPPKSQQVYRLSREQGKSNKEISAEMDIKVKTVENHMTRVLKILRTTLKEHGLIAYYLIFEILCSI